MESDRINPDPLPSFHSKELLVFRVFCSRMQLQCLWRQAITVACGHTKSLFRRNELTSYKRWMRSYPKPDISNFTEGEALDILQQKKMGNFEKADWRC